MLQQTTTLVTPVWIRVLVWFGLPAVGAGLIFLIARLTGWVPLGGPFLFVRALPDSVTFYGALGVGAILGLILAALVDRESLTVRITSEEVVLTRPGTTRHVPRGEVALAFHERDRLVLVGRTGRELASEPCHLSDHKLRAAFAERGIAWSDQDPYAAAYRRWVPGLPEVSATANALFAARQKALDRGDESDQNDLREELGRLGYVVRNEGKRQYWRQAS